jgi:hypothetical protein
MVVLHLIEIGWKGSGSFLNLQREIIQVLFIFWMQLRKEMT